MGEVGTVAVIGAGLLGRGIAHAAALGGYRTILEDILPAALRRAEGEIRSHLDQAVGSGAIDPAHAEAALGRLQFAHSVEEAARQADLVIEAVPDELESKLEIFTLLDKLCRPGTLLATTTASLTVSEIASVTYRAPKCVGMRFFGVRDRRLEIVRGVNTVEETVDVAVEVGRRMSRDCVVVEEAGIGSRGT